MGLTRDATTLQLCVDLACSLTGATGARLVVLGDPELRLSSGMEAVAGLHEFGESGPPTAYAGSAVAYSPSVAQVGSFAVAPITGPSGEPGWIVASSDDADAIAELATDSIEQLALLVEDRLDRAAEQIRLDQLSEVLVQNQTNLQEARDALEISNAELEQFAYLAAHELVAPLRAVGVYAEVLDAVASMDGDDAAERIVHCATEIRSGVSLMDQQVQYLLELSRTQVSAAITEPVDVRDVVVAAVDTLQIDLDAIDADVQIGQLPVVDAKFVPLQSVIANLLSNAVRYREPARTLAVSIQSEATPDGWRISVIDNGVGLEKSDRGRVFKLFERASSNAAGSGIGLALSRRIVEAFGGSMGVDPGVPHGSQFWIEMPRSSRA